MADRVEKRNGKYRIRWYDEHGRRRSKSYRTKSQAQRSQAKRISEVEAVKSGLRRPRSDETVEAAARDWLKTRPEKRRKDDTSRMEHHIWPVLGARKVSDVSPSVIQEFTRHLERKKTARHKVLSKKAKALSPQTIKLVLVCLGKFLGDVGFPQRIKYTVQSAAYGWIENPADVGRFLAECRLEWFRVASALSLLAGLRNGEVAGLRRRDIDWKRKILRLEKQYDNQPLKSKQIRYVPMSTDLASILRAWLLTSPGDPVVKRPSEDGEIPLDPDYGLASFTQRNCKRLGIVPVNFHALRHTYASHQVLAGTPIAILAKLLGHSDISTTMRYVNLSSESLALSQDYALSFAAPDGKVIHIVERGQ